MKKVYHILSFTLILTLFLQINVSGEVIGTDGFDYADGDIGGKTGGQGWDWDNTTSTHTGTVSDWDYLEGTAVVQNMSLVTNDEGGALREYNGPTEGVDADEGLGAFRGVGKVYYGVTMTQLTTNDWCGFSGYDFDEERVFFGQPWQTSSPRYFGVEVSGSGSTLSNIEVVVNESYRLIGVLDFDGDQLRLWINPDSTDYDNGPADNTADATIAYTATNWNTAVRFASGSQTRWDDVIVATSFKDIVRNAAINPYPEHGAVNVPLDVTLSWDPARDPDNPELPNPDITRHFLYMSDGSDDPNLDYIDEIPNDGDRASYGPLGLERGKSYRWRIDEGLGTDPAGDPNNIEGYVWSFETVPSTPIIDPDYPEDQLLDIDDDAAFTVLAYNPFEGYETEVVYQWYKDDVALNDGVTTHGSTVSGAETDTLTVSTVKLEDEGYYFCRVTNTYGNTDTADSRQAVLVIKRILGHWPFDGNLDDIISGNNAVYLGKGNVSYTTGVTPSGGAIEFKINGDPIAISTAPYTNPYWTIVWWDKTLAGTEAFYESMIASGDPAGWELLEADRTDSFDYAVGFSTVGTWFQLGQYPREQWYHHVLSFNAAAERCTWYINGLSVGDMKGIPFTDMDESLYVGDCKDGTQPYAGLIDDLRLYNYTLDPYEAATLYTDVVGGGVCIEPISVSEGDINQDCKIDISDLAEIIAQWLDSNRYYGL